MALDRSVAGAVGRALCGDAGPPETPPPVDLIGVCDEAATRITAYTRLEPDGELPTPEWIGRGQWIDMNVDALAPAMDATLRRSGATLGPLAGLAGGVAGTVAGAEVGALTGLLSQRVMGQVEPGLLREDDHEMRLVLVAPNLAEGAEGMELDHADFVRWVAVHELTHAVQFTAVPWLRPELERLLRDLLGSLDVRLDVKALLRLPRPADLASLIAFVRSGDLLSAVAGDEGRERLDRVQALMGLVEGHAEHVMDAVGVELVGDLDALRVALDERRATRVSAVQAVLGRVLGLEAKLRQYADGKAFCDAVVADGGPQALRRAFDGPQSAPTLGELGDPTAWLRRVG
jgi:coenzyme F420 biosynthesis associated uncharacterized protein